MSLVAKHPPQDRQPSDSTIRKGTVVFAIFGGIVGAVLAGWNDFSPLGVIAASGAMAALFAGISLWVNRW